MEVLGLPSVSTYQGSRLKPDITSIAVLKVSAY